MSLNSLVAGECGQKTVVVARRSLRVSCRYFPVWCLLSLGFYGLTHTATCCNRFVIESQWDAVTDRERAAAHRLAGKLTFPCTG